MKSNSHILQPLVLHNGLGNIHRDHIHLYYSKRSPICINTGTYTHARAHTHTPHTVLDKGGNRRWGGGVSKQTDILHPVNQHGAVISGRWGGGGGGGGGGDELKEHVLT